MSDSIARAALSRMHMREQALAPHYQGFASDMQQMARANPEEAQEQFMSRTRGELCEAYGFGRQAQNKAFAFANGVAIIPVHGTLINRFGNTYGYVTGYNFIRSQHNLALNDPDVTHIIHDHNSYGGEAAGCFELAAEIAKSRGTKPIIAVVDSNCYSASYALASAADKIIATPSSGVGSIGVVAMHVDMSAMLDEIGVKITFIHSGDHKVDGNPYEKLSPSVKASIQKGVDKSRANFVALVAANRGMDSKIVYDTEAETYRADDALEIGLIDKIAAPAAALESITNEDDSQDESDTETLSITEPVMTNATAAAVAAANAQSAPAAPAAAAPDAQSAERARIGSILNCEEAKGNPALANHIAFNTSMSVDDGKAMLAASKPAAPAAAAAAPAVAPSAAAANPFENAMAAAAHPNVGADGNLKPEASGGGAAANTALNSLLGDFERATGTKLGEK